VTWIAQCGENSPGSVARRLQGKGRGIQKLSFKTQGGKGEKPPQIETTNEKVRPSVRFGKGRKRKKSNLIAGQSRQNWGGERTNWILLESVRGKKRG